MLPSHHSMTAVDTERIIRIDFYDVEYDADIGVTYISDLSPKEQAEMIVQKAEFPRNIFSEEEKAFVNEYAEISPDRWKD